MLTIPRISLSYSRNFIRSLSNNWMHRHVQDSYVKQSVEMNMRSRSSFKLTEIQQKYSFIKPKDFVLDLGAAPGGWSIVASNIVKSKIPYTPNDGLVCAIDLLDIKPISGVHIYRGDFRSIDILNDIANLSSNRPPDVIISDMLMNTSGITSADHYRSVELVLDALDLCKDILKYNGTFLAKYLPGSDEKDLIQEIKNVFQEYKLMKPKASRSESSEIYVLCMKKK